ncbi:LamG domain-containing protein [Roseibacillus persicicus]|uniref:LamG domain-containing protein n=1 Tax=Roseibacillus persicicus TaxID=454148 RepID=UPI00398B111F
MNRFVRFFAAALFGVFSVVAHSAEVLLKEIPEGSYFSDAINADSNKDPNTWNPGFRTASAGGFVYLTGWTKGAGSADDGFLSKVDPAGSIVWTKTMRSVLGQSSVWKVNDIEALNDRLYVCGTTETPSGANGKAFIAKLTLDGTLLDYSLAESPNGVARGNALAIGSENNAATVTLVGDAHGDKLTVKQQQAGSSPATVFSGNGTRSLMIRGSTTNPDQKDAFVVRFDENLQATWATTFGNDDFSSNFFGTTATAVAADNTGAIFVALVTDTANTSVEEDTRSIFTSNGTRTAAYLDPNGVEQYRGFESVRSGTVFANDFDSYGGSLSIIYRIDPVRGSATSEITHHFHPIKLEGGDDGSHARVAEMAYSDGSLFVAGEFKKWLRPNSSTDGAEPNDAARIDSVDGSMDIWVGKLSANNLAYSSFRVYNSSADDLVAGITMGSDQSLYLSGVAGGALSTRGFVDGAGTLVSASVGNNSSKAHLFWQKLSTTDLSPSASWHVAPVEDTNASISPPTVQRVASLGVTGNTVVIAGSWKDGDLTLGPDSATRKTLEGSNSEHKGFVGFMSSAGDFLEEVQIAINSEFGNPTPHGGPSGSNASVATVAAGRAIAATVPHVVYEDVNGNILDSANSDAIRRYAVTRRVNTGYQFRNSTQNGTANSVTFVASGDTELTFLWRTEHAVQISSELSGVDGLSSVSAGSPSPVVNKHWFVEGESMVASINGWESDPDQTGVRWRSLGFAAEGVVAEAAEVVSGSWYQWTDLQNRQQTAEIVVNGPGKLSWLWRKEYRVRQAVNSSVAEESPTTTWTDHNVLPADFEAAASVFSRNTFSDNSYQYAYFPIRVTRNEIHITFNEGAPPEKLRIRVADEFHGWGDEYLIDVPAGTQAGGTVTLPFTSLAGKWFEVIGEDSEGNPKSNKSSQWELRKQGSTRNRVLTGVGEIWVAANKPVTVSAPTEVDSGLSTLSLKGYYLGQGDITPSEALNVSSKTFRITEPSGITWDYARAIYPETVSVGSTLTFAGVTGADGGRIDTSTPPVAGNVSTGPEGSTFETMQIWDEVQNKLFVLQPGKFTVEFVNSSAPDDAAKNIIVEVTVDWPSEPDYTHIIETPAVDLDESATDGTSFVRLAHTESRATVTGSQFSASESGRSILLFSHRANGESNGDLERESLSVKVVNSIHWQDSAGEILLPATVGEAVASGDHDAEEVGHNGYVVQELAPVNGSLYERESREGPIFPVNAGVSTSLTAGLSSGLVTHFALDEISGMTANDAATGANAVFANGAPTWLSPGIDFSNTYLSAPGGVGNLSGDLLTIAARIRPDAFIEWGGIVSKGNERSTYALTTTAAGKIRLAVNYNQQSGNGSSPHAHWDSNATLELGQQYHVAVTYDGSAVRFYVDGKLDREVVPSQPIHFVASNEVLTLGVELPGGDEFFHGVISDARVYDRALSPAELFLLSSAEVLPDRSFSIAWYRVQDEIRWPYVARNYQPEWPSATDRIVIASRLGSEGLSQSGQEQPQFGGDWVNPVVYQQADPALMGYNPNEEHALVASSFLDATRSAVFALRNDLNQPFGSEPYVLVQYEDVSTPSNPVAKMKVYSIEEEDATTTDSRLPSFNQTYTYFYQNEAGLRLSPPHPLDTVIGASAIPEETEGFNVDGRIAYYEDKNNMPWCVSGDTDAAADVEVAWHYPLRADFWHPTAEAGEAVSFGNINVSRPRNVSYNTIWPTDVPVLKAGETLTFSGGEYATDNSTEDPKPSGLPQAVSWQSAKQVFDEANVDLTPAELDNNYLARVFPALTSHSVPLALTAVPAALQPAAGKVIVDGLVWHFKDLPASLQDRIYYDTTTQTLEVRGLLNGRTLGDGDLLSTPGAQTILQTNVLTESDELQVKGLSSSVDWTNAVAALAQTSRDPNETLVTNSLGIGLDNGTLGIEPANNFGPGVVVVTNPGLQRSGAEGGYITIAENDSADLPDSPVAMHVIRVTPEKYRGSIAVLEASNVFDEKVTLRHTADFGGDVDELYFEWILREEDGVELNPPGVTKPTATVSTNSGDWTDFMSAVGAFEVQLSGSGPVLIQDNLAFTRYRHKDDNGAVASNWSAWAGAANSRPPNFDSPSVDTDEAYVAQLVPGWIKRVAAAVNLFDARFTDFGNSDAPATYTSAIQQAGQRFEGAVAFNPDKDAIESVGLIELYQTVLDRAEDFTIATQQGSVGVNTALLNAANRIGGLYTLLGNEAYSDALDPLIGFATVGGEFGSLAPTIHAFENQAAGLLDEELSLLRGRAEVGARPSYNRLIWNFTNGSGEAAYVMNYGINDLTEDGLLDDEDARRLYPQGHGDAWGHYTMALKGYYDLASNVNFSWSARSEKYNIDGIVLDIDYQDERAFARSAAARARCGAELVDLSYRSAYTENPDGQWQGYQDVDTDRAWGVFETAQRSGSAAFCDWVFVNAMLPAEETDPNKIGIAKVDRTTVAEIADIAQQANQIQAHLDAADQGLNPAGLNPDSIPFDIDPVLADRTHEESATHFEQVYQRATRAAGNTKKTFDYANGIASQLRQTEATSETLRQNAIDQDRSLRNQMIEVFGSPYAGMIGTGKAYPEGYVGPDIYLWMYVDVLSAGADILPDLSETTVATTIPAGLRNLASDTNPFLAGGVGVDDLLRDTVSAYFPNDVNLPAVTPGKIQLNLPRRSSGYGLVAPDSWGERQSPGEIQASIQELVQAEWRVRNAVALYQAQGDDFKQLLRKFELKSGIAADRIEIVSEAHDDRAVLTGAATGAFAAAGAASLVADFTDDTFDALNEALPKIVGLSNDATAPARGIIGTLKANLSNIAKGVSLAAQIAQYRLEIEADQVLEEMDRQLLTEDLKSELIDILDEIQVLVNSEAVLLWELVDTVESMRSASDRVRMSIEKGQALLTERTVFNQRVASTTTQQRYEDYTFRIFHNEALRKYRSSFDLATRYAYLAGKAYQYELNLPDNHSANASPLLSALMRERTLGEWDGEEPVIGAGGIAEQLAVLATNYDTLRGQLGFNNPDSNTAAISLRRELARVGMSTRVNPDWRTQLESWRVPDLWNYEYQSNGVNYGYVFRRYCRPFAPESAGEQPALVIPFSSTIEAGKNWFGHPIAGGDHAFNSSSFSTKIRSVGIRFDSYNNVALSQTPQAYLIPVGSDQMFVPDSPSLEHRSWNVVDQRIPAPLAITLSDLNSTTWQPATESSSGYFNDLRKFSSFRAYHDAGGWADEEMLTNSRLIGRSVWNTQWVLIIPSASLLADSANPSAGIDTLIHGAPLPGFNQESAGTDFRDGVGVRDIRLLLQTYSVSGN